MPESNVENWVPKVISLDESKDYGEKWLNHGPTINPSGIILHATAGGSVSGAISALRSTGYAYNWLIDKNGDIYKCTPFSKKVSHAGTSHGWKGPYCNSYTFGIAFVNPNDGKTTITAQQEAAVRWLIQTQIIPNAPACKKLSTHYGVSYPRKTDPRTVDARSIAEDCGLEYWPGRRKD